MKKELTTLLQSLKLFGITEPKLAKLISYATTSFKQNDHVKVINGIHSGREGHVIQVFDDPDTIEQNYGELIYVLLEDDLIGGKSKYAAYFTPEEIRLTNKDTNNFEYLARNSPVKFFEKYSEVDLETLNSFQIKMFEKALQTVVQNHTRFFNNESSILNTLTPFFLKNPEYFNFNLFGPSFILDRALDLNKNSVVFLNKLITDEMLIDAINILHHKYIKTFKDFLISFSYLIVNNYQELENKYPRFARHIALLILEEHPDYYFTYLRKIDWLKDNDEIMAAKVLEKDPIKFLDLNLDKLFPTLEADPNQTYDATNNELTPTRTRAAQKIARTKPFIFFEKNLNEEFPFLEIQAFQNIINNERYRAIFVSDFINKYADKSFDDIPEQKTKIMEKIVDDMIFKQNYRDFFKSGIDGIELYRNLGKEMAKKCFETNRELFYELYLENKYPSISPPSPDQFVKILEGKFAGMTGLVTEIDRENNNIILRINMFGRMVPFQTSLDNIQPIDKK